MKTVASVDIHIENWLNRILGGGGEIIWTIFSILLIFFAAILILLVLKRVIKKAFSHRIHTDPDSHAARKAKTLQQLLIYVLRFVVWFLTIAAILDRLDLGVTAGSILATAGVGGVALGIGAQAFVADVVNGFFLLLEDQYTVGDYIDASGTVGTVVEVSLRTTRLQLPNREIATLPNGSITKIVNYSREDYLLYFDYVISYQADLERASALLLKVAQAYAQEHDHVVEGPNYLGAVNVQPTSITLRITLLVRPMTHLETDRELKARVTEAFRKEEIPVPTYDNCVIIGGAQP